MNPNLQKYFLTTWPGRKLNTIVFNSNDFGANVGMVTNPGYHLLTAAQPLHFFELHFPYLYSEFFVRVKYDNVYKILYTGLVSGKYSINGSCYCQVDK